MSFWKNKSELEIVEELAEYEGLITSEEELSERFDEEVASFVITQYGPDDEPAMSEAFNSWTDTLCTDGVIHQAQLNEYGYVGKYS